MHPPCLPVNLKAVGTALSSTRPILRFKGCVTRVHSGVRSPVCWSESFSESRSRHTESRALFGPPSQYFMVRLWPLYVVVFASHVTTNKQAFNTYARSPLQMFWFLSQKQWCRNGPRTALTSLIRTQKFVEFEATFCYLMTILTFQTGFWIWIRI